MRNTGKTLVTLAVGLALGGTVMGCGSSSSGTDAGATLYTKYGGAPTVNKVVSDAVTGLLADCEEAPYFTNNLGKPGHDSAARLEACLRLQIGTLLGGPGTYPGTGYDLLPDGTNDMSSGHSYACQDMVSAHTDIGIPGPVFDKFIMDVGGVLAADGVSAQDISTIAGALTGLKGQVTLGGDGGAAVTYTACDGGPGF